MSAAAPEPTPEDLELREIDREAETALAAIPEHLRRKERRRPIGSARLVFSHKNQNQKGQLR